MMKKGRMIIWILSLCLALIAAGLGGGCTQDTGYSQITADEAKAIMDSSSGYVILDVRTQEEYDEAHIPGAVLIPDYEIADRAEAELQDKEQTILVYCRSGNRSKVASGILTDLGYTNVKEFGGINDWPYDTDKTVTYRSCDKPGDEKFKQE